MACHAKQFWRSAVRAAFRRNYRVRSPSVAQKGQRELGRYNLRSPKMSHRRDTPKRVLPKLCRISLIQSFFVQKCTTVNKLSFENIREEASFIVQAHRGAFI